MYQALIASATVGSGGVASIDFSGIPATYTDLAILVSGRSGDTGGGSFGVSIVFNNDTTATNYNLRRLTGTGTSTSSLNQNTNLVILQNLPGATASTFGNARILIPNYASSVTKTYSSESITENNGSEAFQVLLAGYWSNSTAINRVTLTATSFAQYSTVYLYGTLKGSGGATPSSS
jgi:hypothetical protein